MMINKRLISTVSESRKYIAWNVAFQWLALAANIALMWVLTGFLGALFIGAVPRERWIFTVAVGVLALIIKYGCAIGSARMSYLSGRAVKIRLRQMIYEKLLRLGSSYRQSVQSSEVVQICVEGADQLETYFGSYLPQFFYAMLAPLTLFAVLSFVNFPSALVLLVCVPMIPVSIAAVQTWAKKLLSKYWDRYTQLGDTFLENLQGLTTLKIYQTDGLKHKQMNEEAEKFRRITMRVLTMQLNSISIMDLVAYGGAALGIVTAVLQMSKGHIDLAQCMLIIFLSADFFIPMRMLGSYFHIAMNGMAASDKMFKILDLPENPGSGVSVPGDCTVKAKDLCFSYDGQRQILHNVDFTFPMGSFTALIGESGCGKSTAAGLISGRFRGYTGSLTIGGEEIRDISEESLMKNFTYISSRSHIFKGTVRDNLLLADPKAGDSRMKEVLSQVKLWDFLQGEQGLNTPLNENGSNFSGGQRQRLALARAILHDSPAYIFDEASSNIDVESENDIMAQIHTLAKTKTVIVISHRLANVVDADNIYVMEQGHIRQSGTHQELLSQDGVYRRLWNAQQKLEEYVKEAATV